MKNTTLTTLILLFMICSLSAQQEKGIIGYNNWLQSWTEFSPSKNVYNEPTQILTGTIDADLTLKKRDIYLLLGDVFVTDSTTLTIEPGTVILGDYKSNGTLTITKGSKIVAKGEQTDPIIFTSNRPLKKPGDWGGIFILGNAPTNKLGNESVINYGLKPDALENLKYGGDDTMSNSGIMRYVRVEFAGKRTKNFGHFSGLTLAGIGEETVIDNVMVSYCSGNSFNILGGNVIIEKLVSYKSNRNDYAFNDGTQTSITNSLAIRSPYVSSSDGFRSMYISSYKVKDEVDIEKAETNVYASNVSLINVSKNLDSDIKIGLVKEAIYIKNNASFAIDKSVISGFFPAVILDNSIKINNENLQKIKFERTYFNNCKGNIFSKYNSNNEDLESWYGSRAFDNVYSKGPDTETFIDIADSRNPDFRLRINKIIATTDTDVDDDD
ncbi:hypothetical protein BTO05_02350 [Winogradskyella sp. PC-19]|uniref:hypothetical protein n=1 Tax=unclassified Winogradskyella TaxID=2615021 RepID=UPI000B3D05DA|nr:MULTISPECIES: hypothetical protein [unclassified Winogradskyella]ARV08537.1 hypothetical protein BTO05_02350 [Winogradskyella sp. PC-19]RZN78334.1 MAG: hypothetical protein EVB12_05570 [Winogradskyella sp.]